MTDSSNYRGFPRYTGPEQGFTLYPPKDESWRELANCQGLPAEWFFPARGDNIGADSDYAQAKQVCARCEGRWRNQFAIGPGHPDVAR
jgi:hypothetical protein